MIAKTSPRGRVVRFGVFEVDLGSRELRKSGVRIKLQGQPFEVLAMLLERPGEAVTREELQQRLWPTDTFVDFDHGVNGAVNRLREALGDSPDAPRFVETLPRRGYRFLVPVESLIQVADGSAPDLAGPASSVPSPDSTESSPRVVRPRMGREQLAWIFAALLAAMLFIGFAYERLARSTPPVVVSDINPPKGTTFNFLFIGAPAVAPDGHAVAFATRDATGKYSIWVRPLDGSPAEVVRGTDDAGSPFWSPDSRRIGFFGHSKLTTVEASGGSAMTLNDGLAHYGGTWSRAGTILFVGEQGIYQVPASGGPSALVVRRDASKYAVLIHPSFLPDSKHFLYGNTNPGSPGDAYFASLDGKENRLLLQGSGRAIYASGFLLYIRGGNLVAQPFEPATGHLTGTARPIAEQVQQGAFSSLFDASENGVLAYAPARGAPGVTQPAWFDRTGNRLGFIGVPAIHYDVRLSPDGRRLASSAGAPKSEMWVDDLQRGVRMRLTFDPDTDNGIPVWSPDGSSLLFSTLRGSKAGVGIFRKASNGAGNEALVLPSDGPDREAWATDWSPDGRFLLFSRGNMAIPSEADIWVLPLVGEKKPVLFLKPKGSAYDAQFSPDGRWVAYTSTESGGPEVYVAPFDAAKFSAGTGTGGSPRGKWQISSAGGWNPRWRRDGKELFYIGSEDTVMAVEVGGKGANFEVGRSQHLFVGPANPFIFPTFDVTPDGQRFVMNDSPEGDALPLVLMLNWTARAVAK